MLFCRLGMLKEKSFTDIMKSVDKQKGLNIKGDFKMKKSKRILTGLMALTLALSFTACSTSKTTSGAGDGSKKVKLKVIGQKRPDQPEYVQKQIDKRIEMFKKKYPNIELELVNFGSATDYRQEYDKQLMAGTAPDVIDFLPFVDIPSRISNHTVGDLSEFVNDWDLKKQNKVANYFDGAVSKDGKSYAVPCKMYYSGLPYYAPTIKEGGGDPDNLPKTWDDLNKLGQKITDPSKPRYGLALLGMDWNAWEYTAWVWSAGGDMVTKNSDGTWKLGFNEQTGVDAAMQWHDMIWKYKMTQKNILEDWNGFTDDIASGRAAFGWKDIGSFSGVAKEKYNLKEGDFGIIPVPGKDASKQTTFVGGEVLCINPKITDKEVKKAAWEYILNEAYDEDSTMAQYQIAADNNALDSAPPVNLALADKYNALAQKFPDRWKKDFPAMQKAGVIKPEPYCNHWNDVKNTLSKPLQKILLTENLTNEECAKILNDAANDLYNKYPDTFKK